MSNYNIEKSAILTLIGVVFLFSFAVIITLIAPRHIDPSWSQASSPYQVQMYEVSDPNVYIGNPTTLGYDLQFVYHLKKDFSLLAFQESDLIRIITKPELEKYITRHNDSILKLTSQLLLLRTPTQEFAENVEKLKNEFQTEWEKNNPDWQKKRMLRPDFQVLELYSVAGDEAFSVGSPDTILEDWIDTNYKILDEPKQNYHRDPGVIYVRNPSEYRISYYNFAGQEGWRYDPNGEAVKNVQQLVSNPLGFRSRQQLIELGEHIFAIEGCWYCHTDQTRTLVQDVVLNGSDSYPAPPSAANEYIYQRITFPGTRRIGPDISRTGIKRPSRDWHRGHFWSPVTASKGSIMPTFRHFFDIDPRGTSKSMVGIPNYQFEAIFQYLMTKGTRITAPTQAWWLGKDPIQTKEIIEGQRTLAP